MGTGALPQPAGQKGLSIGVVAALPAEMRSLYPAISSLNIPQAINPCLTGIICGVGADNAGRAAELLIQHGVTALVSWGTAGALSPELHSGDVLIPERVLAANRQTLAATADWSARLQTAGRQAQIRVHGGMLAGAGTVQTTTEQKTTLGESTGAVAVDMESATILRVALSHNLPCVVVRAIIDRHDDELPVELLRHIDAYGRPAFPGLVRELAFKPGLMFSMLRLSAAMRAATRSLRALARQTDNRLMYHQS